MKHVLLVLSILLAMSCADLMAQTKLELQPNDTILSILQRSSGQTVELRLTSGEKMGGKVEKVGDKLVYLSQLTGADYFDAVVDVVDISAVVVRKSK